MTIEAPRPEGETGTLFSLTEGYSVWDRAPGWKRPDRFALYDPNGVFVGLYDNGMAAEREAAFRLMEAQ